MASVNDAVARTAMLGHTSASSVMQNPEYLDRLSVQILNVVFRPVFV
jgi:hypothetical protein